MIKNTFLLLFLTIFLSSCISKKQFLTHKAAFHTSQDSLGNIIQSLGYQKDTLRLALSYERGVNAALLTTQDRLQNRLDILQLDIDNLGSNASNNEQKLFSDIKQKEKEILALDAKISNIQRVLDENAGRLTSFAEKIQPFLNQIKTDSIEIRQRTDQLIIVIGENALFRKSSTNTILDEGKELLNNISEIIQQYPEMQIHIVGHTDNRDVNRQNLDNWQYSALRAVSIVKYLTNETDLGANRVMAATKSEFSPLQSNETKEGRARNRRIEIIITTSIGFLEQKIIQKL